MFNMERNVVLTNKAILDFTGFLHENFNLYEFDKLFGGVNIREMIDKMFISGKVIHVSEVKFKDKFYEFLITPVGVTYYKTVP